MLEIFLFTKTFVLYGYTEEKYSRQYIIYILVFVAVLTNDSYL